MRRLTRISYSLPHNGGAHSAPARERRGAAGPPRATEPGSGAEPRSSWAPASRGGGCHALPALGRGVIVDNLVALKLNTRVGVARRRCTAPPQGTSSGPCDRCGCGRASVRKSCSRGARRKARRPSPARAAPKRTTAHQVVVRWAVPTVGAPPSQTPSPHQADESHRGRTAGWRRRSPYAFTHVDTAVARAPLGLVFQGPQREPANQRDPRRGERPIAAELRTSARISGDRACLRAEDR